MDYQISLQTRKIASPQSEGYTPLWFGYVDESGDPAAFSQQPLVLTAIMTQTPRALELIARRA